MRRLQKKLFVSQKQLFSVSTVSSSRIEQLKTVRLYRKILRQYVSLVMEGKEGGGGW